MNSACKKGFNEEKKFAIGVDLGGSKIGIALVSAKVISEII
jgi:predicted NBD/HSP70 family sugar kinase